jgi:1-pyrroline-5-carboxylate dehydrogenase
MSVLKAPVEPSNEIVRTYAPGTAERQSLKQSLNEMSSSSIEIPLRIGGSDVRTGNTSSVVMPHAHRRVLASWHKAGAPEVEQAIRAATDAHREWATWKFEDRAAIFLRAADLLSTSWRDILNGATMLNQSKTVHQAEIDSACEMIDFLRFNVAFARQIHANQPLSPEGTSNFLDYRPLEGFVYAVTPFNFTAIAGNLPSAPALMGNTVVWKCASSTVYSNFQLMKLFEAAGLPPGVINFVPGDAAAISDVALRHRDLAGIHFTGSTDVFLGMWRSVGANIANYKSYPRLVGETGGKDFIVVHASADVDAVITAIIRGGFEYQGQKCSAASRVYLPDTMWAGMRDRLVATINDIKVGDVADFSNFMGAVIDAKAFRKISGYMDAARHSNEASILAGGTSDDSVGYFVRPTLIVTKDPAYSTMCEEIFGPVVTVFVYPEKDWRAILDVVDRTSPYALTGAILANDRRAIDEANDVLRYSAGNFYINDKPTGAVVGQQPFGGSRASGTNDKAGSMLNLLRWVSARTVKETFNPAKDYRYPFMQAMD